MLTMLIGRSLPSSPWRKNSARNLARQHNWRADSTRFADSGFEVANHFLQVIDLNIVFTMRRSAHRCVGIEEG